MSTVFAGIMVTVLLRPAISEYLATRTQTNLEARLRIASHMTREDARYHYLLGLLSYKSGEKTRLAEAVGHYRQSLRRDPTRALAWLDLSKIYKEKELAESAEYAVRQAVRVDRANPKVLWEAGMFYLLDGRIADAAPFLRAYLTLTPDELEQTATLLHSVGARAAFVMEKVVPETYASRGRYFRFLMHREQNAELWETWENRGLWKPSRQEYLTFCDFLIGRGQLDGAQSVWSEFVENLHPAGAERHTTNLVFNGDFRYPIQDGGFDWKLGKAEGVTIALDQDVKKAGFSSLTARFNGKTNPGVCIAQQIVPVTPNERYRITAFVKTEGLTTTNGVLIEAVGHKGGLLNARSEVLTGTSDWRPVELTFVTPANCDAVKLGIKRERSEKFDNKISGKVWIDSVRMSAVRN